MEKLTIRTDHPYEVLIDRGLLAESGELIRTALGGQVCKVCLVTDSTVGPLYAEKMLISLADAGFETCIFQFPAGEKSKNTTTLINLVEYMARHEMTRTDLVVALGGGVTGDLAGFAASIYMRGIRYIQVPTTLLACVDSSVGGKTASNLAAGKNFIGTFWQPQLVICDYSLLDTLPRDIYSDGVAEAIKCGAIRDPELFKYLGNVSPESRRIIESCVRIKAAFVEEDEKDHGARALLNFGHTLGHAIEKCSDYTITHGHAVSIGMVLVQRAAYNKGMCSEDLSVPIANLLAKHGLPTSSAYDPGQLAHAVLADKKRVGTHINVVLLDHIGSAHTEKIAVSSLRDFITAGL